ncbi:hypothetical protein Q8W71_16080 [Methylobacterium sp. NEAU 140]|uniref:hypothetical protein n=1 Tax=Methylobacterium sp. NEAU 140 TaxID=3064945 RepID=UPI002734D18F|nr:hypothetical protein [Methylobacterium sp. NEAU 140]MDP4024148.1 hypothetical protein [Methylobacterium sp. NEAU 140]
MHHDAHAPAALRTLNFRPGISGLPRAFRVRAMQWRGVLWLVAKDAGAAIGWHPDTFRHRRGVTLTGDAWSYATVPTARGAHMMAVVSLPTLGVMLKGTEAQQARAFGRWLSEPRGVV